MMGSNRIPSTGDSRKSGIPPSVLKKQIEAKRREALIDPNSEFKDPDDVIDEALARVKAKKNLLKSRIKSRKFERNAITTLVRADAKALISAVRKEGRLLIPKKAMEREIRMNRVIKENGIMLLAVAENRSMTRTLDACSNQQLKVEKQLLLNKGVAKADIKDRLPVATALHSRVQHMREIIAPKKKSKRMSGSARVEQELDFGMEPLARPCLICQELVVPALMKVHLKLCQVRHKFKQVGGGGGKLAAEAEAKKIATEKKRLAEIKKKRGINSTAIMAVCHKCGRRVMANRLKKHMSQCAKFTEFSNRRNCEQAAAQGFDPVTGCSVPEPPTDLIVKAIDPMTIRMTWKTPVYNGGKDIFDYMVCYQIREEHRIGKKYWHTFSDEIKFKASRFCVPAKVRHRDFPCVGQTQAIAHTGFTLTGCNAATDYANFKVSAINSVGESQYSFPVSIIRTPDACGPYPPLHVTVGKVTSSSIELHWCPPMLTGGVPLKRYEVYYSRFGWKDLKTNSNDAITNGEIGGKQWYQCHQSCSSRDTSMTLQKLEGGAEYRDISVVAINRVNIKSSPSPTVKFVMTKEPDKAQIVRDELRRARKFKHQFIDTEFMLDFPQRFSRTEYIHFLLKKLEAIGAKELPSDSESEDSGSDDEKNMTTEEIKVLAKKQAKQLEEEERIRKQKIKDEAEKDKLWKGKKKQYELSKKHFAMKILACKNEIKSANEMRDKLLARRSQLSAYCKDNYARLSRFNGERERVENTSADWVDTCVLHGLPQRFRKDRLRELMQEHTLQMRQDIAVAKFEINQIERDVKKWNDHRIAQEAYLADRLSAQYAFEKSATRTIRMRKNMMKLGKGLQAKIFSRWVLHTEIALEERRFCRKIINRALNGRLLAGFSTWKINASELGIAQQKAKSISGIGSVLLLTKEVQRKELTSEVQEALNITAGVSARLQYLNRTERQTKFQKSSVFFKESETQRIIGAVFPELIEDDDEAKEKKKRKKNDRKNNNTGFDSLDESEESEEENTVIAPIDPLAQGDGYLKMGQTDKAIVMYELYLKRAKIAKDVIAIGNSFGRIGKCYQQKQEYNRALISHERHLQIARECDHNEGKAVAYLGLAWAIHGQGGYRASNDLCYKSIDLWHLLRDQYNQANVYKLLALNYGNMREHDKEEEMTKNAERVEKELIVKVKAGIQTTTDMIDRITGVASENKEVIPFQNCTPALPRLKRRQARMQAKIDELLGQLKSHKRKIPRFKTKLEQCQKQLTEAESQRGVGNLDSDFLHDDFKQRFTIDQLKTKLGSEIKRYTEGIVLHTEAVEDLQITIRNVEDQKKDVDEYVRVEGGQLMLKVINQSILMRCIAFNKSNLESMDVTGTSTGGKEFVATAIHKSIRVCMFYMNF